MFLQKILIGVLALSMLVISCREKDVKLIADKEISNYPSGSGLACYNGKLFIIGDDAADLFITDTALSFTDSLPLFATDAYRIGKETKADLEAIAVIAKNSDTSLLLVGSGSKTPNRDSCFIIDPQQKTIARFNLDTFYYRLRHSGIAELNVEAAASTPGNIVLANRGNKSFPRNHLIFVPNGFWKQQTSCPIRIIKAGINTDTANFQGISGMDYSYRTDILFLTISTENTYNSYDDGTIGKSYLWIIRDLSSKKRMSAVNPNEIIDLEEIDDRFKHQKIESVCIISENLTGVDLALVADDDKGGSTLFKLRLSKKK